MAATILPSGKGSVAEGQYGRLSGEDSTWTSDDLIFIFDVYSPAQGQSGGQPRNPTRTVLLHGPTVPAHLTAGQDLRIGAALRLPDGRIARLPTDSPRVGELETDPTVTVRVAMKSSR